MLDLLAQSAADLIDRVRADEALQASEERYRTLFTSIDVGYCVIRVLFDGAEPHDYVFEEVNPAFARHTGIENALGRSIREIVPDHDSLWDETYGRVALSGRAERFESFARALHRWYDVYAFRIGNPEDHRVAVLFSDITQRKEAESALEQANLKLEHRVEVRTRELVERAEQLQRLASDLTLAEQKVHEQVAKVLHDGVQQLLFGARLRVDRLRRGQPGGAVDGSDLERLGAALDEAIAAIRALSVELAPPVLRERGLAAGLAWLADWMHATHGLTVHTRLDDAGNPEGWDVQVLIFESVRELLFNVVKHGAVGEASLEFVAESNNRFRATVSHEGMGFDPGAVARERGGAGGLGLFSIRERLALLGGRFEIQSEPNVPGVRFTLVGHRRRASSHGLVPERASRDGAGAQESAAASGSDGHITVMLVGHNADQLEETTRLLADHAEFHVVKVVDDVAEAVSHARRLQPDVVVVSRSAQPGRDVDMAAEIQERLADTPVIDLMDGSDDARVESLIAAGAAVHTGDGEDLSKLIALIRSSHASGLRKGPQP